ncbi:hypothetical protein [Saccharopolyspora sp. ASAGF58]|nr:hypothetical protein [Saccharopolyspora sp. ASAGF58]
MAGLAEAAGLDEKVRVSEAAGHYGLPTDARVGRLSESEQED